MGKSIFLGKDLSKYHSNEWDDQRNAHVGYIFQNYHLQPADNVAFVLNMLGITNKEEVDKRVSYILNPGHVCLSSQKKRYNSPVDNNKVAITCSNNLDNKNTTEIMNIISKISQTRLVVMVTHEKLFLIFADLVTDKLLVLHKSYRLEVENYLFKSK